MRTSTDRGRPAQRSTCWVELSLVERSWVELAVPLLWGSPWPSSLASALRWPWIADGLSGRFREHAKLKRGHARPNANPLRAKQSGSDWARMEQELILHNLSVIQSILCAACNVIRVLSSWKEFPILVLASAKQCSFPHRRPKAPQYATALIACIWRHQVQTEGLSPRHACTHSAAAAASRRQFYDDLDDSEVSQNRERTKDCPRGLAKKAMRQNKTRDDRLLICLLISLFISLLIY